MDALRSLFFTVAVTDSASASLGNIDQNAEKLKQTFEGVDSATGTAQEALQKLNKGALVLGGTLTAIGAAGGLYYKSATDSAAKYSDVHASFVKMVGEDAEGLLEAMKRASGETVRDIDLITSANKALLMGIDPKALPRMMEIARAAARATGQDVSFMFESIMVGTARQSRLILDNLGIIVTEGEAYEKYAKSIGKTTSALTEQEKKLAFQALVMERGQAIIDRTDMSQDSLAESIQRVSTNFENFKNLIGRDVAPIVSAVANALGKVTGIFEKIPAPIRTTIAVVGLLGTVIVGATGALLLFLGGLAMTVPAITAAGGVTGILTGAWGLLTAGLWGSVPAIYAVGAGIWAALAPLLPIIIPVALAIAGLILLIQDLWTGFSGGDSIVLKALGNIWESIKGFFSGLWDVMKSVGKFLIDALLMGMTGGLLNTDRLSKVFGLIREYLPFSDAEKGPLSDLTESGGRFMETFAKGAQLAAPGIGGALSGLTGALFGGGAPSGAAGVSVTVNITGNTISGDEGSLKTLAGMTASAVEDAVMQLLNRQAARAGI